jgi:uroporphyrinogen III methyltransferase/synthase
VAFVTGHEDPGKPESALDWAALAAFPGTLVFYMGVRQLPRIADALIAHGRAGEEAAAVIERGTLSGQRTVVGSLATIAAQADAADIQAPSITLVGPVVDLRRELAWLEARPLHGRTVAVTRARAQASELAARLQALGADVVEAPAIRIVPRVIEVPDLAGFDLVCLTSPNGVRLLFDELLASGRDARALAGARVAAIGPGTAHALADRGIRADVVPERFVAEGLLEALADVPVARALVARASEARDVLPDELRARGADVEILELYDTVAERLDDAQRSAVRGADYVTFTSSSTVRFLIEALGEEGRPALDGSARIASIGPVTSQTLREHGLEPHVEAERHDIDGLVDALVADAAR